jgi:hypothetical protein
MSPRQLVSQYASPVNIMNSKASPANTRDTDNRARAPYVSTVQSGACGSGECSFTAVPANMRLVVTHLDAVITIPSTQGITDIILSKLGSPDKAFPQWMAAAPISGFNNYIVSQALDYYVDGGGLPTLDIGTTTGFAVPNTATLTGYLVDCTTGCAAIVH